MSFAPSLAYELLEVGACIEFLVFRREVVQDLGTGMNTCWSEANVGFLMPYDSLLVPLWILKRSI
jgi:hypothetical protein